MIENPNRLDVLTKGSALIVASGAVWSASPGKTQEGSTEPGFIRFDHARALYIPHSDSPPFGLYATVFPRINPEELFDNSREVKLHDVPAVGMVEFTPPKTVGYILLASRQGEGGVNPELLHEQISSGFLEKSEELLHFFAVPPTGIPLADYMEGARINYKIVEYMDRHEGVFSLKVVEVLLIEVLLCYHQLYYQIPSVNVRSEFGLRILCYAIFRNIRNFGKCSFGKCSHGCGK